MLQNTKDLRATAAREIANYTAIERLAAGDASTARLAASIREDKEKLLERMLQEKPKPTKAEARGNKSDAGSKPSAAARKATKPAAKPASIKRAAPKPAPAAGAVAAKTIAPACSRPLNASTATPERGMQTARLGRAVCIVDLDMVLERTSPRG